MVNIREGMESGPISKPPKRVKKVTGLKRGGRKPKDAGKAQERKFANAYGGFERVVGSGAFGGLDPLLQGDVRGIIGRKRFLLEMKAWATVDGTGAKTINVPLAVLDKIRKEAEPEGRYAGVVFHPKGTNRYIAMFDWNEFYMLMTEDHDYETRNLKYIETLEEVLADWIEAPTMSKGDLEEMVWRTKQALDPMIVDD